MGRTGSGKSTVGKLIAEALNWHYVSTGDIARSLTSEENINMLWQELGQFAPEEEIRKAFEVEIMDHGDMVVIDGMPRKIEQINYLQSLFGGNIDYYLLDIDKDTARKRLFTRNRLDDTISTIENRLRNFDRTTMKAIRKLEQQGLLNNIDGNQSSYSIADIVIHRAI